MVKTPDFEFEWTTQSPNRPLHLTQITLDGMYRLNICYEYG